MRGVILALLLLASSPAIAMPEVHNGKVIITYDPGGSIDLYLGRWNAIARRHIPVEIRGECTSACTMVLGIIPRDQLCATKTATFGLHLAGWFDPERFTYTPDLRLTWEFLFPYYPRVVKNWIKSHGGLELRPKYMPFTDFHGYLRECA